MLRLVWVFAVRICHRNVFNDFIIIIIIIIIIILNTLNYL